jgi:beta-lactamase class A
MGWLGIFSGLCLLAAATLFVVQLAIYSRALSVMPAGLSLGGVPVGGLTEPSALEQLVTAYQSPIELRYRDQMILLDPDVVGFQINADLMLPEANQYRNNAGFWGGFWNYLWLQPGQFSDVPLRATYSAEKLRAFLEEIAARYDRPGNLPYADVSSLGFVPGEPGHTLDVDAAISLIDAKLHSPSERVVDLPVNEQTAVRPSFETLEELIRADVGLFEFDGIFSLYLADLETGRELTLNLANGTPRASPIAFSGMSTIKIPIMADFFAHNEGNLTDDENLLLQRSIDESANTATDLLLKTIGRGDGLNGTQRVAADMQRLGLVNTYISGLLDVQGAVLAPIPTPANARTDITTRPDPYNQTTSEEMGVLLSMIYQCSKGGGALMAAFPGQYTPEECQTMIKLLSKNEVGPIFISGAEGVVAHKHGWDRLPLTNVADAALVFTPNADYALTIFLHHPETIEFEEANRLIISVAQAIYNFFNPRRFTNTSLLPPFS